MTAPAVALAPTLTKLIRQDVPSLHACTSRDLADTVKFDAIQGPHRLPDTLIALEGLRNRKVALKNVPKMHPLQANGLRVSFVGTADEKCANAGRT